MELACPQCGKESLHHSRPRSLAERIRRWLTGLVPVRCHSCGWRGWRRQLTHPSGGTRGVHRDLTESELEQLDPDKPLKDA